MESGLRFFGFDPEEMMKMLYEKEREMLTMKQVRSIIYLGQCGTVSQAVVCLETEAGAAQ